MKPFQLKVEKPWGYELVLTPPEAEAVAKILHLNQGARFSLQYHEKKVETLILIKGKAIIIAGEEKEEMRQNHGYLITPRTIHRCEAISDCDIFESSTKEEGTTIRLQDDYSRGNETMKERNQNRKSI